MPAAGFGRIFGGLSHGRSFAAILCAIHLTLGVTSGAAETPTMSSGDLPGQRVTPGVPSPVPDDETLVSEGAVIGAIVVRNGDIFDTEDPKENTRLFRAANAIHVATRPSVIRRQLLFHEGEPYDPRLLRESERLLRMNDYLYDAKIRAIRFEDGRVDVEVRTRDVWTLKAGIGIGRAGGVNTSRLGIEDSNFLGFGKEITVRRLGGVDRTTYQYRYRDRNLFGSRASLELNLLDNSDGSGAEISAGMPFYCLDCRWSAWGRAERGDQVTSLYDRGEIVSQFGQSREFAEVHGGWSAGARNGRARRWLVGYTYDRNRFGQAPGAAPGAFVPPDRTLAYPWFEVQSVQDGFVEVHDLDKIFRTEDVNLASQWRARLGFAAKAVGSDRTQLLWDATWTLGTSPGRGQILTAAASTSGRYGAGAGENVRVAGALRWYVRDFGPHVLFVGLQAEAARNLDPEQQILIGGDTGLRGYPLRYQAGNKRALLTVEQRFYSERHLLRLFRVGGAVFFDVGRAWAGPDDDRNRFLRDVGVGLRLGSSRSSHGAMVHVDLAVPLDGGAEIHRVQILVTTRDTF